MAETIKEVGLPQQPKNVQNVGIFEEVDSFDWPKMQLAKKGRKNSDRGLPTHWQMPNGKILGSLYQGATFLNTTF